MYSIWLACHGPLDCNSGQHVVAIANDLKHRGYSITVCAPHNSSTNPKIANGVRFHTFAELTNGANRTPPDLVHFWTARESMRGLYRDICKYFATKIPYVIHLEDNELVLLGDALKLSLDEIEEVRNGLSSLEVPDHLTHPLYGRQMLESASGVTALIESLTADLPPGLPYTVFAPGFDPIFSISTMDAGRIVREELGIPLDTFLVTYTGNVHCSNVAEVRSLYIAVALLNNIGTPVKLLRTGLDFVPIAEHGVNELRKHAIDLGFVPRADLPRLVHAADLLIQPGSNDDWNAKRIPSKLPDFLISSRPVMLPRVNLGHSLLHGENAIILPKANAESIAVALLEWLPQRERLCKIGAEGAAFARRFLQWSIAVNQVDGLYRKILSLTPIPDKPAGGVNTKFASGMAIRDRYGNKAVASGLSVATVADFVDSHENLRNLATAAGDLKDVQRPWMLKAIAGTIPTGGKLCEIGAGEPLVADILVKMGYKVTIVDPYDGSGNGPKSLDQFRKTYPNVRIIRSHFSPNLSELIPGELDAVYSISVLEHLDVTAIKNVIDGATKFLRKGGQHIHAIDFVAGGAGAESHRRMLDNFLAHFKITAREIDALLEKAMCSTETYFLSAESHNRWRGNIPYESFPMRKVISVQFVH